MHIERKLPYCNCLVLLGASIQLSICAPPPFQFSDSAHCQEAGVLCPALQVKTRDILYLEDLFTTVLCCLLGTDYHLGTGKWTYTEFFLPFFQSGSHDELLYCWERNSISVFISNVHTARDFLWNICLNSQTENKGPMSINYKYSSL